MYNLPRFPAQITSTLRVSVIAIRTKVVVANAYLCAIQKNPLVLQSTRIFLRTHTYIRV